MLSATVCVVAGMFAMQESAPVAAPVAVPLAAPPSVEQCIRIGAERVLGMEEAQGEWPYEGVYRVRGEIPMGYRIGGTGICAQMLLAAPAADDAKRDAAIARAAEFVCSGITQPDMSIADYSGGYDVRAWGYCYGAKFLLALRAAQAVPAGAEEKVDAALRWYLAALQKIEIPQVGGWNYARQPGAGAPSPASPFMTAPCLLTLFEARAQGFEVDSAVVERGLTALERCRSESGNVAYSAKDQNNEGTKSVPGATGRMTATESALFMAGRSDAARLRGAVEAFIAHWDELEKRRAKPGTHAAPYGVAPYYFYYAHLAAAQAVELLPEAERGPLRERLFELLLRTRSAEGTWDDRVFPRTANFGTATAVSSLLLPNLPRGAGWPSNAAAEISTDSTATSGPVSPRG